MGPMRYSKVRNALFITAYCPFKLMGHILPAGGHGETYSNTCQHSEA